MPVTSENENNIRLCDILWKMEREFFLKIIFDMDKR